jgi:CBS domain-containing protein
VSAASFVIGEGFIRAGYTPSTAQFGLFFARHGWACVEAVQEGAEIRVRGIPVKEPGLFVLVTETAVRRALLAASAATRRKAIQKGGVILIIGQPPVGPFIRKTTIE